MKTKHWAILTLGMIWATRLSLTALSDPSELPEMAAYLIVFTAFICGIWWKSKAKPGAPAETIPTATVGEAGASKELIYFRLVLACSLLAMALSAVTWSYCKYQEIVATKHGNEIYRMDAAAQKTCLSANPGRYADCINKYYDQLMSTYANESQEFIDREELAMLVFIATPTVLWVIFYLVRWSVLGRVRPLWLLGKN